MSVIRPATREEISWISSRLRPADYREIKTGTGMFPVHALLEAPLLTTFTIRPDPKADPVCLFGIFPQSDRSATVWLVGTDDLPKVAKTLLGELPKWLKAWSQQFALIYNHVDSRNKLHHRYLRKLGFEFGEAVEIRGVDFYEIRYPCALP